MMPETCRDVLAELLDRIDRHTAGGPGWVWVEPDRIRAAIAADDVELARLRRIEESARDVDDALGSLLRAGCAVVAHNAPPEIGNAIAGALASLSVALMPPTMRQIHEAQRIAGDGGRDDG